jgi:methionyl-tRNA formyltransferase
LEIHRKIRGLSPWPGATAEYTSKKTGKSFRVTITKAEIVENKQAKLECGTIDADLNVVCGQGAIKILKIKPAGKGEMDFGDFVNGRQTAPGDFFGKIDE